VLDQRGQLSRAALGFAGCSMLSYDRALWALRTWLDSWPGIGHVAVGMHRQVRLAADAVRRPWLARDLLHDGRGALADERDGHGVGAHAVARATASTEDHGLFDNGDGPEINSHHFATARRSSESR